VLKKDHFLVLWFFSAEGRTLRPGGGAPPESGGVKYPYYSTLILPQENGNSKNEPQRIIPFPLFYIFYILEIDRWFLQN
jgi:hypothetical protein